MATPAATYCNVGVGSAKNNYKLDYSPTDGAGILTLTVAQYAASTGILTVGTGGTNIMYDSPDGMMMLRADVDTDPIAENGYPRSEGREMALDGTSLRSFDRTTGDHSIKVIFKVTHLPPEKPSVVVCQMHDENDDIVEFAVQPVTGYNKTTNPKVELVCRINGSSAGIPKLVADFQYNTVYQAKIRVGAIASGSVGWEAYIGNLVTPKVKSSDAGMPAMTLTGTSSYFKFGCYLQTKHTGNGTGGLETDVNEYGEVGYRDAQTSHNGETAPATLTFGTQTFDAVSNVRWGTKASGHRTVNPSAISVSPGLPSSLVNGDLMLCIVRATRGVNSATLPLVGSPYQSLPSTPTMSVAGWNRIISTHTAVESGTGAYAGGPQLAAHNVRWLLFAKKWVNGDLTPTVDVASGTTLTDTLTAQILAFSGSKYSTDLLEVLDKPPAGLDMSNPNDNTLTNTGITYSASTSTTLLGPGAAIASVTPGCLAIACVYHETNVTTGGVAVVTGTDTPALTWAEGGEGATTTTVTTPANAASEDESAFGHDWAIVPGNVATQAIAAKTAAATISGDANLPNTGTAVPGKGWGVLFTIAPAKRVGRRRVG